MKLIAKAGENKWIVYATSNEISQILGIKSRLAELEQLVEAIETAKMNELSISPLYDNGNTSWAVYEIDWDQFNENKNQFMGVGETIPDALTDYQEKLIKEPNGV